MKKIGLFFGGCILLLACNQSSKDGEESQKPANTDTLNSNILNADTVALKSNVSNADTAITKPLTTPVIVSLQNLWALESINNELLKSDEFPRGTPYLELNLTKKQVSGHAGCNGFNGSFKLQGQNIIFGKLITTKTTCSKIDFENQYLKGLSGQTVAYTTQDGRLHLKPSPETEFIYHKIQQ